MKNLVIFGSGFHAKVLFFEIQKLKSYKILGFVDDLKGKVKILNFKNKDYKVLDKTKNIVNKKNLFGVVAHR